MPAAERPWAWGRNEGRHGTLQAWEGLTLPVVFACAHGPPFGPLLTPLPLPTPPLSEEDTPLDEARWAEPSGAGLAGPQSNEPWTPALHLGRRNSGVSCPGPGPWGPRAVGAFLTQRTCGRPGPRQVGSLERPVAGGVCAAAAVGAGATASITSHPSAFTSSCLACGRDDPPGGAVSTHRPTSLLPGASPRVRQQQRQRQPCRPRSGPAWALGRVGVGVGATSLGTVSRIHQRALERSPLGAAATLAGRARATRAGSGACESRDPSVRGSALSTVPGTDPVSQQGRAHASREPHRRCRAVTGTRHLKSLMTQKCPWTTSRGTWGQLAGGGEMGCLSDPHPEPT